MGWTLTSISGDDSQTGSTATVNLLPGETRTVTFTNTELGKITVVKEVVTTTPDGTQFSFTTDYGDFSLTSPDGNPDSNESGYLTPNAEYDITEGANEGWTLTSISGDDSQTGSTATVNLLPGENREVTFINTELG